MPRLQFTPQLRRFTAAPELEAPAATLMELLRAAFEINPLLRGYVLDEQDGLRPNVAVFVDGRRSMDPQQALQPESQVYVMQALSGG
ncbi:hypothetical protein HNQ51_000661 [Inhella inkyongensis]|uniref:MoaD/ThiS family protein n=1 Tax=Inhella inkyongensis TaxID=392593 RepID=A0A840S1S2_9BURK|nr:MoaD/ThiS family protein [Inhella inkyongensis]MBB5203368.1 hypothetical protein [Inhella inkyongensis]